jgi:hypothetical protein
MRASAPASTGDEEALEPFDRLAEDTLHMRRVGDERGGNVNSNEARAMVIGGRCFTTGAARVQGLDRGKKFAGLDAEAVNRARERLDQRLIGGIVLQFRHGTLINAGALGDLFL